MITIRRPRDLTELECLYTDEDSPECRAYLGENTMETETIYRFVSGVEVSAEALDRKVAGDRLHQFAKAHQQRRGGSYSDALAIARRLNPEIVRQYLGIQ